MTPQAQWLNISTCWSFSPKRNTSVSFSQASRAIEADPSGVEEPEDDDDDEDDINKDTMIKAKKKTAAKSEDGKATGGKGGRGRASTGKGAKGGDKPSAGRGRGKKK